MVILSKSNLFIPGDTVRSTKSCKNCRLQKLEKNIHEI